MREKSTAFLLMCLLVCFWGLDYVVAKDALNILEPMNLLFLKYLVGALLVFGIKLKQDQEDDRKTEGYPFFYTVFTDRRDPVFLL